MQVREVDACTLVRTPLDGYSRTARSNVPHEQYEPHGPDAPYVPEFRFPCSKGIPLSSHTLIASDGDQLHALPAVASRLSVSRATVYEFLSRGALRSVKIGHRRLVRESDLQAFIGSLESSRPGA